MMNYKLNARGAWIYLENEFLGQREITRPTALGGVPHGETGVGLHY